MKIWWCQEHGDNGNKERCSWQWVSEPDEPCRMVPMRLIPDNAKTVDREALVEALERIDDGIDYADPEAQAIVEAARWVLDALSVREAE